MSQFYTKAPDQSPPPPREGLPPCLRFAIFEDRVACLGEPCARCGREGWVVQRGGLGQRRAFHNHEGTFSFASKGSRNQLDFSNRAEAAAAWERAERWVRTGVLDDG